MSVNKAILIGNLGDDPKVTYTANGNAIANIALATSEKWKDKQTGQQQEKTSWHRVVFFGKIAEVVGQYLRKGSKIYVEGKMVTREWEKDGVKRYTTEVVVDMRGQMQMLDGKQDGQAPQQRQASAPRQQQSQQSAPADYNEFDSDIPFVDPYRGRLAILV